MTQKELRRKWQWTVILLGQRRGEEMRTKHPLMDKIYRFLFLLNDRNMKGTIDVADMFWMLQIFSDIYIERNFLYYFYLDRLSLSLLMYDLSSNVYGNLMFV